MKETLDKIREAAESALKAAADESENEKLRV